jgi:RimJ/RimL family protein N-acetyltransferase
MSRAITSLRYVRISDPNEIQRVRSEYTRSLRAPLDGMWERSVIDGAQYWGMRDQDRCIGYYCQDSDGNMVRFHVATAYQPQAQELFLRAISHCGAANAIVSTFESLYCSLCLDAQKTVTVHTYLFRDGMVGMPSAERSEIHFRPIRQIELKSVVGFYQVNTEGPREWIEGFLCERIDRDELFGFYSGDRLIATGECIPSETQRPYADLGMVVARSYRGKGLGSAMLMRLKQHCYEEAWVPICSCAVDNVASQRAIEKAGFVSEHRMLTATF